MEIPIIVLYLQKNKKILLTLFKNSPYVIKYWLLYIFDQNFYIKKAHSVEKNPI